MCFSSGLIITKSIIKEVNSDVIAFIRQGFALLLLLLLIPILKINPLEIVALKYVIIVGLIGPLITVFLNRTITISTASYATMMSMSVPVIVTILSLFFLKEPMNIYQIIGGALILVSGILTQKLKI